jgi:hypothetical protein
MYIRYTATSSDLFCFSLFEVRIRINSLRTLWKPRKTQFNIFNLKHQSDQKITPHSDSLDWRDIHKAGRMCYKKRFINRRSIQHAMQPGLADSRHVTSWRAKLMVMDRLWYRTDCVVRDPARPAARQSFSHKWGDAGGGE